MPVQEAFPSTWMMPGILVPVWVRPSQTGLSAIMVSPSFWWDQERVRAPPPDASVSISHPELPKPLVKG